MPIVSRCRGMNAYLQADLGFHDLRDDGATPLHFAGHQYGLLGRIKGNKQALLQVSDEHSAMRSQNPL